MASDGTIFLIRNLRSVSGLERMEDERSNEANSPAPAPAPASAPRQPARTPAPAPAPAPAPRYTEVICPTNASAGQLGMGRHC